MRWLMWVRVNAAFQGTMEIVFTAKCTRTPGERDGKGVKGGTKDLIFPVFLPHFFIPVARMQIDVDDTTGSWRR